MVCFYAEIILGGHL